VLRKLAVPLATIVTLMAFAAPAGATVVFEQNDEIWAMNDDGSSKHVIASATRVPGMMTLSSPFANASGVVTFSAQWSEGEAERTKWIPHGPGGACGAFCVGVYKLDGGVATRLSPTPAGCPVRPCLISEGEAEFVSGGPVYYSEYVNTATHQCGFTWCTTSSQSIQSRPLGGGDKTDFGAACNGATDPSPKPDGSNVIAYTGCQDNVGQWQLIRSDADGNNAVAISVDDAQQFDPSWSPDGSVLLTAEGGADRGVWATAADGSSITRVVAIPDDHIVRSPRFIGPNTIGFVYGGFIWTVPANCNDCGPTSGAELTSSGAGNFAWTPATSIEPLRDASSGGGGGTGGGAGGGGGGSGGGVTPRDSTSPGISAAALAGKPKLGTALKKGFDASLTTTEGGAVTIQAKVSGKDAKGLKLAATKIAASGRSTAPGAGKHKVRLRFTKKAQKKFRRARKLKLTLAIVVVDAAGNRGTKTAKVTLKR
jgi:hypothetical protein